MTSANITIHTVTNRKTGTTKEHSQHCMCKDKTKEFLAQFTPPEDFHVEVNHPDEEEAPSITFEGNLKAYLSRNGPEPLCPVCAKPLKQDTREVLFTAGTAPVHRFTANVRAIWCPDTECQYPANVMEVYGG